MNYIVTPEHSPCPLVVLFAAKLDRNHSPITFIHSQSVDMEGVRLKMKKGGALMSVYPTPPSH